MSSRYRVSVDPYGRRSLARVTNHPRGSPPPTMRPRDRSHSPLPPPQQRQPPPGYPPRHVSSMIVKPSDDEIAQTRPRPSRRSRPRSRLPDRSGNKSFARSASPSRQQRRSDGHNGRYSDHPGQPHGRHEFRDEKIGGFRSKSHIFGRGRGGNRGIREISPSYEHISDRGRLGEYPAINGHGRGENRGIRESSASYAHISERGRSGEYSAINGLGRGSGRLMHTQFGDEGERIIRDLSPLPIVREMGGERNVSNGYEKGGNRGRSHDLSPAYIPDKDGRRFLDISNRYEAERIGGGYQGMTPHRNQRKDVRNFSDLESSLLPLRDVDNNSNIPDIPSRVRDRICSNPLCRNLTFEQRVYCNNCNKFRHGPVEGVQRSSSHRQFYVGPHSLDPLPVIQPIDHDFERGTNGYRSPPHSWARDSPRGPFLGDNARSLDVPRRREFVDHQDEIEYRERNNFNRPLPREWGHQECGQVSLPQGTRMYERDNGSWGPIPRERSHSPRHAQPPKDSPHGFGGRERGDRQGVAWLRGYGVF